LPEHLPGVQTGELLKETVDLSLPLGDARFLISLENLAEFKLRWPYERVSCETKSTIGKLSPYSLFWAAWWWGENKDASGSERDKGNLMNASDLRHPA
jgi:hypothetical protein